MIEPNDFFGGGLNESRAHASDDSRSASLDFDIEPVSLDHGFIADVEEEVVFSPMFNLMKPDLETRMRLYLKPNRGSIPLQLSLVIFDTVLACAYLSGQFAYVIAGSYTEMQDKLMQLLIGFGLTGAIMFYCIADAVRFLRSWPDRILYAFSCVL